MTRVLVKSHKSARAFLLNEPRSCFIFNRHLTKEPWMKLLSTHQRIFLIILAVSLSLLGGIKLISSLAQTSTPDTPHWKVKKVGTKRFGIKPKVADLSDAQEQVIEDQIPSHLPIKVELKNLEVEPMLRNLELQVTNTSEKPIYYLELVISLPDVLSPTGHPIAFTLRYGRTDLIDFQAPLQPDDVPLRPGESCILSIPDKYKKGLDIRLSKLKMRYADIKRVYLFFQLLNFGDKTGFSNSGGAPIPTIPKSQILKFPVREEGRWGGTNGLRSATLN
jgi:hypothetical protein